MQSNLAFGQWLKSKREESALSIFELACKIGASKHQKWERKIHDWELGNSLPKDRLHKKICAAFNIQSSEWTKAYRRLVVQPKFDAQLLEKDIPDQNRILIATHFTLLQGQSAQIQQTQQWRDIHLHDFHVGLMYMGGNAIMRLGPLLDCWNNGKLISRKENRLFYALHGGGSPLSYFQVFHGFYAGCKTIHKKNRLGRYQDGRTVRTVLYIILLGIQIKK